jgi:hypothetical protein
MIAVGAADRRITTYPGPSPTAANVKISTLVPPRPRYFLLCTFALFLKIFTVRARIFHCNSYKHPVFI